MSITKDKQKDAFKTLKDKLSYTNVMQAPKITKVIISVGFGSVKDPKKVELIADRLQKITGQKPLTTKAKKSIASFKVRQGNPLGYKTTLRGERMYDFLDRLLMVSLPRTRDFKGIGVDGFDAVGNYTLGIKEHTIFPETSDEDIKDVFGLAVTVVTTAKNKEEATEFLKFLGFPFKKNKTEKKNG
jgi:large subunit ribosomal protein L5